MGSQFTLTSLPQYIIPRVNTFCTQVQRYYHTSSPVITWMEKRVTLLTQILPKPGPCIVYHLWKAAPYVAANILLPHSWFVAGVVAAAAYYFMTTPMDRTPDLSPVANGVGFSYTLRGTGSLFAGALSHNPVTSITGLFQLALGGICLYASGFADTVRQPFVPPPPSGPTRPNTSPQPAEEPLSPALPLAEKHPSSETPHRHRSLADKIEGFACRVVEKTVLKQLKISSDTP